jgi:N,N-dimethylformamidase
MTGYETGAPYRVLDAQHWAFGGSGLAHGDLFGHASLDQRAVGGASGHETDKVTASAPPGLRVLAKGTNPDDGGGEMVCFDTASGGAVFSVGSISYTCSILVDDAISQITANVLRRFLE